MLSCRNRNSWPNPVYLLKTWNGHRRYLQRTCSLLRVLSVEFFFLHTSFVCKKFDIGPPLLYTVVFMRFLAPSFVDCWNCLKLPHSKTGLTIHIPGKPYAYSSFTYQTLTGIYKFTISKTLHMNFITILILWKSDMYNRSTIYYIQYICIYIAYRREAEVQV